jgi:hypothetical protein
VTTSRECATEIEHTTLFQTANLLGYLGQFILGPDQAFELGLFPNRCRRAVKALLPKVQSAPRMYPA